jgi:hypothetical protein
VLSRNLKPRCLVIHALKRPITKSSPLEEFADLLASRGSYTRGAVRRGELAVRAGDTRGA